MSLVIQLCTFTLPFGKSPLEQAVMSSSRCLLLINMSFSRVEVEP